MPNPGFKDLVIAFGLPPETAYQYMKSKGVKIKDSDFEKSNDFNHDESFTISGAYDLEILKDFKTQLELAIDKGLTKAEFLEQYRESTFAASHLNLVYDMNLRTSFVEGRKDQMRKTANVRPFVQRFATLDARTTPQSRFMDKFVFRQDDRIYKRKLDIMSLWRDRDFTITLTKAAVKRQGLRVRKGKTLVNKMIPGTPNKKGKRKPVPLRNPKEFWHNPDRRTAFKPQLNKYDRGMSKDFQTYVGSK